jgi:hypothetical protein
MTSRRARFAAAGFCGLLLALTCSPSAALAEEDSTMTLEDVVRQFVEGRSPDELIRRIESSQVDFDLAEEMLEELRLAGLPEEVIGAMVRRQRELHPPPTAETEPAETEPDHQAGLIVTLTLQGGTKVRESEVDRALRVADLVPAETLTELGIRDPEARITNVAVYVACHSSTHVPDHWRGKSPLGRDFHSVSRHKMLAFHSEATPDGKAVLSLALPEQLEIELDPAAEHDLSVGVAVQIDGRYYRLVSDETRGFVPAENTGAIEVTFGLPDNLDPASIGVRLNP